MNKEMALVCVEDFEEKAETLLEKEAFTYYRSGAGAQISLNLNREAFRRLRIRPRYLRDVSFLDTKCTILGMDFAWPVGIAPTAIQKMAHADGETGNAKAAGQAGSPFVLSTLATTSIEEIASTASDTCKWIQLYIYKDRSLTEHLLRRAEKANFKAIVLTIDSPVLGNRRNNFRLPQNVRLANLQNEHSTLSVSGTAVYASKQFDSTLTWKDVSWLVKLTKLPVILKGILTREDATLAREFGCAGIIVSNHGARQLDSVPATIEVLPEIVRAVGNDLVVMLDGGITQGNDIFKALALGAKMVFIGRAAVWGLVCNGQKGVEDILTILKNDFNTTMALAGCQKLSDISKEMVVHELYYSKL